jgi:hypothetical protein
VNPLIKQTGTKLKGLGGFELIDRGDGHVIATWHNTFDLSIIAEVYQARLNRMTEIRQKIDTTLLFKEARK